MCNEIMDSVNTLGAEVWRDSDGVMRSSYQSYYDAAAFAAGAYHTVGEQFPILDGFCPRPKPVAFSRVMSRLNLVGIYIPFTFEANVNADVPDYVVPSSMMHELAHYKGFMREDEANFISYIACRSSASADFEYSGAMLALIHSSNALYSADKDAYWAVMERLTDDVREDFRANQAYWKQFEGPVAEASAKVNDVYLKTNNQTLGVKSYGRMVDLLLAEYRQRHDG